MAASQGGHQGWMAGRLGGWVAGWWGNPHPTQETTTSKLTRTNSLHQPRKWPPQLNLNPAITINSISTPPSTPPSTPLTPPPQPSITAEPPPSNKIRKIQLNQKIFLNNRRSGNVAFPGCFLGILRLMESAVRFDKLTSISCGRRGGGEGGGGGRGRKGEEGEEGGDITT